jgi:beta-glucosidase-like glycosyl hydrolase/CubicO group peptidase (beta-lactamase class C family)
MPVAVLPLLLLSAVLLGGPLETQNGLPPDAARWVEHTLSSMTIEQKLGQLVMVHYYGGFTNTESDAYRELLRRVEQQHIGGIVVATRPGPLGTQLSEVYPTAILTNQLQHHAKIPLLVAADFERGTAMRLAEGTSFPYAMGVAAAGNPQDACEMARITALEARAVGVHWNFAPVADVNVNPQNPIINTRAFGEDPTRVAEFVTAFIRCSQENGVLATAKHFPGHGDTSEDSHIGLPTIPGDRARLERVELVPFRAAIAAGVSAIMTAHLAVPALEPEPNLPATMSKRILTDLLRGELGFQGLIVTDALTMGGVTALYSPGEVAVGSVEAGADVLLVPPVPDAALLALRRAVEQGRLSEARIDESVRRILTAKARLGLHRQREADVEKLSEVFARPEFRAKAEDIAGRGVTLLRDEQTLLPLDATKPLRVLLVAVAGDPDPLPGSALEQEIRWRVDSLQTVRADTQWVGVENLKLPPPASYEVAVAALFVRLADRKGHVSLPSEQVAFVRQLLASGKPVVIAAFGSPYVIERFPEAKTWIAAFSTHAVAQVAVGRALFGQTAIAGKLPVTVPGVARSGEGMEIAANPMRLQPAPPAMDAKLAPGFALVEQVVNKGLVSGAAVAVGYRNQLAIRAFGKENFDPGAAAVSPGMALPAHWLARPLVAGLSMMVLVEQGLVQLNAPAARYLPELARGSQQEWRQKITVRHLLQGSSGLAVSVESTRSGDQEMTPDEIIAAAAHASLRFAPGSQVNPSFLETMLLEEIERRVTGKLSSNSTMNQILSTVLRAESCEAGGGGQPSSGQASNTVQGWAGQSQFFCSARDLSALAQMLLNGGIYGHQRILKRSTVELFTARQRVGDAVRALGWAVGPWNGGPLSRRAFGSDGPSGASFWVDPEKRLFVIFLPAEVRPGAEENLRALREQLHRQAADLLGAASAAQ